jgi:Cu/Ag efflux pump CusA
MVPVAFGFHGDTSFRAPMAIAVIGGLITSTLLTLFVVPVVYTLLDDFTQRLRGGKPRVHDAEPVVPEVAAAD